MKLLIRALHDLGAADAREVTRHRAHRLRDRPLVVVQDHEHALAARARVVERLERDARSEARVADHRDRVRLGRLVRRAAREAERQADAGACVTGVEQVVLALVGVRESAQPVGHAQLLEALATPGEDLVRIALVADIPHAAIALEVEHVVQRGGELDHAEVRAEVAAGALHGVQQEVAHLGADLRQRLERQALEVGRAGDAVEQRLRGALGGAGGRIGGVGHRGPVWIHHPWVAGLGLQPARTGGNAARGPQERLVSRKSTIWSPVALHGPPQRRA